MQYREYDPNDPEAREIFLIAVSAALSYKTEL